jgi:hypothetical protein
MAAERPGTGADHPLYDHRDVGQPAGPPHLQDVRHLDRGGPRPHQSARGDRVSGRASGGATAAAAGLSRGVEAGHRPPSRPRRRLHSRQLRPARRLAYPARPAHEGAWW